MLGLFCGGKLLRTSRIKRRADSKRRRRANPGFWKAEIGKSAPQAKAIVLKKT